MKFKKTPQRIMDVIELFHKNGLIYSLFKCEHIFEGKNKNLDILFKTNHDYCLASKLLSSCGFVVYLSENVEKYKRMFVKWDGEHFVKIHLHREIAWHGLKVINKNDLFNRQKKLSSVIFVPSDEDQLIIHLAHIIFENWEVNPFHKELITTILPKNLDWNYINTKVSHDGWYKPFKFLLESLSSGQPVDRRLFIQSFLWKAVKTPESWFPLIDKLVRILSKKLISHRRGCLISLVGVNGSGKTTLVNEVLQKYHPISDFVNGSFGYYFGWKPYSPWAKLASKILKKNNTKLFEKINSSSRDYYNDHSSNENLNRKTKQVSLLKELFFFFNFIEYLLRYLNVIRPKLCKNKLVVTDRYFYDLYGQYEYSSQSLILKWLLKLFPKPNYLFILDAQTDVLMVRDKTNNLVVAKSLNKTVERKVHKKDDLEGQRSRYQWLQQYLSGELLSTTEEISSNINKIIDKTWVGLVRGNFVRTNLKRIYD